MKQIGVLKSRIEALTEQAQLIDKKRKTRRNDERRSKPLFDDRLFKTRSGYLVPYLSEAKTNLSALTLSIKQGSEEIAEHLALLLQDQLSAVAKVLEASNQSASLSQLYRDLAQHQEWLNRLKTLVEYKQLALAEAAIYQRETKQQDLVATQARLARCQEATLALQQQINQQQAQRRTHYAKEQQLNK